MTAPPVASAPAVKPSPVAHAVPPAPAGAVGKDGHAAEKEKASAIAGNGNGRPHVETSLPASAPAADGDGVPSVAVFREDLLQTISDRTGYPIEMLDEKLELEAGLGIDSIKTIEIFGLLSKYHAYLPGANDDQEESLAAFAKLRTIADILGAYEVNANAHRQQPRPGGDGSNGDGTAGNGNGSTATAVERATLTAVEAPRGADGQKKNSRELISS